MLTCSACHQLRLDPDTLTCAACGRRSADGPADLITAMDGTYHNLLVELARVRSGSYQQVLGLFGPRAGRGPDDGVAFSEAHARLAHRYFTERGLRCALVALTADRVTAWSVVVALDGTGLEHALRDARREASRRRATLKVTEGLDGG